MIKLSTILAESPFFLGGIAMAAIGLVVAATWTYGPGLEPDTASYVAAAEGLLKGQGLIGVEGNPFVLWPPLFPLLIAMGQLAGLPAASVVVVINSGCFALAVVSTYVATRAVGGNRVVAKLACAFVVLTPTFLEPFTWAMSEPLFISLTLASLLLVAWAGANPRSLAPLVLAALAAATTTLTRYLGLAAVGAGTFSLLIAGPPAGLSWKRRIGRSAVFAAGGFFPVGVYLLRNVVETGTFLGPRLSATRSVGSVALNLGVTATRWLVPLEWIETLEPYVTDPTLIALVLLAVVSLIVTLGPLMLRSPGEETDPFRRHLARVLLAFVGTYLGVLSLSALSVAFDSLAPRFLSPVFVPIVCLMSVATARLYSRAGARHPSSTPMLAMLALALVFTSQTLRTGHLVAEKIANGAGGYATRPWQESPTIRSLSMIGTDQPIFGNAPDAIYLMTGRHTASVPRKVQPEGWEGSQSITAETLDPETHVVWLRGVSWRPYLIDLDELVTTWNLVVLAQTADGTIYRIRR